MGLLDNIQPDADPLAVTLDFSQYEDGEKLSTLARDFFAERGADYGASTIEEYFASLLLARLKEALVEDQEKILKEKIEERQEAIKNVEDSFKQELLDLVSAKDQVRDGAKELKIKKKV